MYCESACVMCVFANIYADARLTLSYTANLMDIHTATSTSVYEYLCRSELLKGTCIFLCHENVIGCWITNDYGAIFY